MTSTITHRFKIPDAFSQFLPVLRASEETLLLEYKACANKQATGDREYDTDDL